MKDFMWAEYRSARVSARHARSHQVGSKQETRTLSTSLSEMVSLKPILLAAAAVCVFAKPQGSLHPFESQRQFNRLPPSPSRRGFLSDFFLPRMMAPRYQGYDGSPVVPQAPMDDWLKKEIERISLMEEDEDSMSYEKELPQFMDNNQYLAHMFSRPAKIPQDHYSRESVPAETPGVPAPPTVPVVSPSAFVPGKNPTGVKPQENKNETKQNASASYQRINFALTPLDNGYFDPDQKQTNEPVANQVDGQHEGGGPTPVEMPSRQIRQNPNLSKTKNLVADQLDRLRIGLITNGARPRISGVVQQTKPAANGINANKGDRSHDGSVSTEKPNSIMMQEPATQDPASIYSIVVISAVATALGIAIIGFAYGWYSMTKRAKAAADVDYPAYGVTGPTADMTGDRKLAHSAHMYHYQHQKQQIIAMERNGMEHRNGSISDPESEEENEEGDYTVYECPGFATTGDMEVKNPLFTEDPTPATPGKCELVKPQPKE